MKFAGGRRAGLGPFFLRALILIAWCAFTFPASAACQASCTLSGVVNDYWPGSADAAAGATTIALGARRAGGGVPGQNIAPGDWVIVIQMQDALYNSVDSANYGAANGTGRGYTQPRQTGLYEFAQAASGIAGGAGVLTLAKPLLNSYNAAPSGAGAQTLPRFQLLRIPNCVTATLSGALSGPHWNGSTGGVVALRGQALNMGGASINANGLGFRGGATDVHNDVSSHNSVTFQSTAYENQYKGEGIAATPDYVYDLASGMEISTGSVMPGGYRSKGAPGNAGGGGSGDAGGGGGGNGGGGGHGGVWSKGTQAGLGGAAFTHSALARLALGGGGGGGSAHPGQDGGATFDETRIPAGNGGNGYSRGGAGGGIVILSAVTRTGSLSINADGTPALGQFPGTLAQYNMRGTQVGAGGGAGGSVALFGTGGSISVSARGGDGYSMRAPVGFENYYDFYHYAHGGGGGGGAIWANSLAGISAAVAGGAPGCLGARRADDATRDFANPLGVCSDTLPLSSESGAPGFANAFGGSEAGAPSCPAQALLKVTKTNGVSSLPAGAVTTYTIQVSNDGPSDAPGTVVRDIPSAGLNCTGLTFTASPPGAVTATSVTVSALLSTGIELSPTFSANSTATFQLSCKVTASGLP